MEDEVYFVDDPYFLPGQPSDEYDDFFTDDPSFLLHQPSAEFGYDDFFDSELDFAYRLQLEEAISASMENARSSSSSAVATSSSSAAASASSSSRPMQSQRGRNSAEVVIPRSRDLPPSEKLMNNERRVSERRPLGREDRGTGENVVHTTGIAIATDEPPRKTKEETLRRGFLLGRSFGEASSRPMQPQRGSRSPNVAVPPSRDFPPSEELVNNERRVSEHRSSRRQDRRTEENVMHMTGIAIVTDKPPRKSDKESLQSGFPLERPFGEGSSKKVNYSNENGVFTLYSKGMVSEELINGKNVILSGAGVAISDPKNKVVFELKKPLMGNIVSKNCAEIKALIEGLDAAVSLGIRRISIAFLYKHIHRFVAGKWQPKQRKIAELIDQVFRLRMNFQYFRPAYLPHNSNTEAFRLARAAIVSQMTKAAEANHTSRGKTQTENCVICLEDTSVDNMLSVDVCRHRYCFSCMKQHVIEKLRQGMLPKCPHDGCKSVLKVESCRKFLTPKLLDTLAERIKEASIPVTERVYCPYPRCSVLMIKSEVAKYAKDVLGTERSGARKCLKCHGLFCVNCKVPWHNNMTCNDYKRSNPNPPAEDVKLKYLASANQWRQCVKCNHMIELTEGCYHMTCRCGYEFCYNCGAERKNTKATCSCPSWEEHRIWNGDSDEEFEDENEEDEFEEDYFELYDSDEEMHFGRGSAFFDFLVQSQLL